ncbi:MAG TPA: alpha/beta hydrolase [Methylocella sp.]|nr:alpha/beta hydrolase [Methylocella sp.]
MLLQTSAMAPAEPQWLTLPPAPGLPQAEQSGPVPVNGIKIWHAVFGQGEPVILLHGGLANANYFGHLVPALAKAYRVIVMDSRGHGRSMRGAEPLGYSLMASDVIALMDDLKIGKAAIVGWSDGAITGLEIAMNHPERLTKLFAFAANSDPAGLKDAASSPVFQAFLARAAKEYEALSPAPDRFASLRSDVMRMWAEEPDYKAQNLRKIRVPVWIAGADRDEAIKRENIEFMAGEIPGAGLLIMPNVSHFAMLQDPELFNSLVMHFLQHETPR